MTLLCGHIHVGMLILSSPSNMGKLSQSKSMFSTSRSADENLDIILFTADTRISYSWWICGVSCWSLRFGPVSRGRNDWRNNSKTSVRGSVKIFRMRFTRALFTSVKISKNKSQWNATFYFLEIVCILNLSHLGSHNNSYCVEIYMHYVNKSPRSMQQFSISQSEKVIQKHIILYIDW